MKTFLISLFTHILLLTVMFSHIKNSNNKTIKPIKKVVRLNFIANKVENKVENKVKTAKQELKKVIKNKIVEPKTETPAKKIERKKVKIKKEEPKKEIIKKIPEKKKLKEIKIEKPKEILKTKPIVEEKIIEKKIVEIPDEKNKETKIEKQVELEQNVEAKEKVTVMNKEETEHRNKKSEEIKEEIKEIVSDSKTKVQETSSTTVQEVIVKKTPTLIETLIQEEKITYGKKGELIAVNQNIEGLNYSFIKNPAPKYPRMAKKARIKKEVVVKVRFLVGYNGKIEEIKFYDNVTKYGFREEVKNKLNQWELTPIKAEDQIVKMYFYKIFRFSIN